MGKKHKYWTVEDWKKVLFLDENHFFVQGKNSNLSGMGVRRGKTDICLPLEIGTTT